MLRASYFFVGGWSAGFLRGAKLFLRAKLERQSKARLRKTSVREARSAERPKTQRRIPSSNPWPQSTSIVTESLTSRITKDAKGKGKLELRRKVTIKTKVKVKG